MDVKRNSGLAYDIAQMIEALEVKQQICARFGANCKFCLLGKLGVFESFTCNDIDKLIKRLELVYKVVETL